MACGMLIPIKPLYLGFACDLPLQKTLAYKTFSYKIACIAFRRIPKAYNIILVTFKDDLSFGTFPFNYTEVNIIKGFLFVKYFLHQTC